MSQVLTRQHPVVRDVDVRPERHVEALPNVAPHIDWMLGNLRKQFDRLTQKKSLPTMMTPILPEHMESMRRVEELLLAFQDAVCTADVEEAKRAFQETVDFTACPPWHPKNNPVQDPRTYYWQILSWHETFKAFREDAAT